MSNPIIIGFTVLEAAKLHMSRIFYDFFRKAHPNITALYGDTDSLVVAIPNVPNIAAVNQSLRKILDLSTQPRNSPLFNLKNQGKLGYMKDEMKGEKIAEFVGIRSKVYSIKMANQKVQNTLKGVKSHISKKIPFNHFKKCLKEKTIYSISQKQFFTKQQKISIRSQKKVGMTPISDKTWVLSKCGIHSVPLGSIHFKSEEEKCTRCEQINYTL